MIAVGILDQHVGAWCFDTDAFVTVGHLEVVQMTVIVADQIDPIGPADIRPASTQDQRGYLATIMTSYRTVI